MGKSGGGEIMERILSLDGLGVVEGEEGEERWGQLGAGERGKLGSERGGEDRWERKV